MSTAPSGTAPPAPALDPHHDRRWLILVVIGVAQLMVVLDATIVNIALPSAQRDLGFGVGDRQWIITAYALAFGSLLLIGGRIGDLFGRRRVFVTGLLGFAAASALGGAAQSFGVLVSARALQGVFGALLAPAALSLLTITFTAPAERGKAFGIFGAIAGGGAAVGLLLGGVLTQYLSWRWCLYVNLFFAVPAATAGLRLLHDPARGTKPVIDYPGTLTASLGLFALVFGFSRAEADGWAAPITIAMFVAFVVLIGAFVALQRRVARPLLPLHVVLDRNRGGAYLAMGVTGIAMFGVFLFLTFYMQQTLRFSPIATGLAFLPMSAAIMTSATLGSTMLLPRMGPRPLITIGMLLGGVGMLLLAQLGPDSSYAAHVLPALLILGLGLGNVFAPAIGTATLGVEDHDAGVASAMVNTMQQVGGAIGTALLTTLFASAVTGYATSHPRGPSLAVEAAVHGYTTVFWIGGAILIGGALVVGALLRGGAHRPAVPTPEPVPAG